MRTSKILRLCTVAGIMMTMMTGCQGDRLTKQSGSGSAKNVLMIVVDDLRTELSAYDDSVNIYTPNIQKLADRGLVFMNAYCQFAVCSPSRNSFMSGRRPDTTKVWNFKKNFREAPGGEDWVTFPEAFKNAGFNTTGCGKTYHSGQPKNFDEPKSWTQGVEYVGYDQGLSQCPGGHAWCKFPNDQNSTLQDAVLANRAIELLTSHKTYNVTPFFVAAGFIRPHLQWAAPQWAYDHYPLESIKPAEHPTLANSAPKVAWVQQYVNNYRGDLGDFQVTATDPMPTNVSTLWRQAYYASVTYVDSEIGRVLDTLDELGLANDTVVALMADHGYQLGEHSFWEKYTNYELATRVPFIISDPSHPDSHGKKTAGIVESVDMYPTLASLVGITNLQNDLEGYDASPLLADPTKTWKKGALSQFNRCVPDADGYYGRCAGTDPDKFDVMGYAVRTKEWRYIEWFSWDKQNIKADFNATIARELYNHQGDEGGNFNAEENDNVAEDAQYADVVAAHAQMIRDGWQKLLPSAEQK